MLEDAQTVEQVQIDPAKFIVVMVSRVSVFYESFLYTLTLLIDSFHVE